MARLPGALHRISIHAPHTGSDPRPTRRPVRSSYFNPRSPYGERLGRGRDRVRRGSISIHAPHTGSDPFSATSTYPALHFNPRSPYGERPCPPRRAPRSRYFNPRSPYGERPCCTCRSPIWRHFNPRSPYGERLRRADDHCDVCIISIHAPHTGSDAVTSLLSPRCRISIHAPHTGSDQLGDVHDARRGLFQSTLPIRGAATAFKYERRKWTISIHAPHTGSDNSKASETTASSYFNPRSPYGERRCVPAAPPTLPVFQSTLPIRGATSSSHAQRSRKKFQSTLPIRGATLDMKFQIRNVVFQSTLPIRGATYDELDLDL